MSHPIDRACPLCGAEAGQSCRSSRGLDRRSFHRVRGKRAGEAFVAAHGHPTESPIEDMLVGSFRGWLDHHEVTDAAISTQVPIGPYRADMVVEACGRKLVVECDGVAFHSSLEAIERDKRRDRFFVTQGIYVMRFTGPEIRRDPRGCAAQIGLWVRAQR